MVIQNDPSARMQVRTRGELVHPGSCMVCGNGTHDDGYLDLGVFYDYEGTMYLCMTCITQAGETVGLYTPDEVKMIQGLGEKLATENESLRQELADARQHISSISHLLQSKFSPSDYVAVPLSEESNTVDEVAPDITPEPAVRKPEIKEPTPFSRSDDTSGDERRNFTFK